MGPQRPAGILFLTMSGWPWTTASYLLMLVRSRLQYRGFLAGCLARLFSRSVRHVIIQLELSTLHKSISADQNNYCNMKVNVMGYESCIVDQQPCWSTLTSWMCGNSNRTASATKLLMLGTCHYQISGYGDHLQLHVSHKTITIAFPRKLYDMLCSSLKILMLCPPKVPLVSWECGDSNYSAISAIYMMPGTWHGKIVTMWRLGFYC